MSVTIGQLTPGVALIDPCLSWVARGGAAGVSSSTSCTMWDSAVAVCRLDGRAQHKVVQLFFQFSSVCAFSGRPMAEHAVEGGGAGSARRRRERRLRTHFRYAPLPGVHTTARHGEEIETHTHPRSGLPRSQARSTFRWISMTHLLPCGQTPCLSPRGHWFARGAEFAWCGPGHGASEHRCAPSRCFSVSDDRGRPLAGQRVSPVAVTAPEFLGQTRSLV